MRERDSAGNASSLLRVNRAGEDHCIATWNNVLLTSWRGVIHPNELESTRSLSFELAARYRDKVVVYNIIEKGIPMPSNEVRKRSSEIMHETGGHVRKTSTVVLGEGFSVSAVRAAIATMTLFARMPHPQKVFSSLADGADWVAGDLCGPGATPADLAAVGERIRRIASS